MLYNSTRGGNEEVSSAKAIIKGLCDNGGLFVPQQFPVLNINECVDLSYTQLAYKVLSLYLTDYTSEMLQKSINDAYKEKSFAQGLANIVEVKTDKLFSLELWHGPTCAFKDYALQLMPRLLVNAKKLLNCEEITKILVATSGDTGKAALDGYANLEGIKLAVFYPNNGTSEIQRLQMATQQGENVAVYAVNGNFDDCQTAVKTVFNDKNLATALSCKGEALSSANSINWGRLAPQIVYYVYAYCSLVKSKKISIGDKLDFCVPTGNFGDILAGFYAKKMGLPIRKLICASNKNNVLYDFIKSGKYNANRDFYKTTSPSMDILVSSNLERLLYHLYENGDAVNDLMQQLSTKGEFTVSEKVHQKILDEFECGFVNDAEVATTINNVYEEYNYLIDTHTATAFLVAQKRENSTNNKCVVVSTANPFKFSKSVLEALGADVKGDEFEILQNLEKSTNLAAPKCLSQLNSKEIRFDKVIEKSDIGKIALDM